jgi:hypothetical protein
MGSALIPALFHFARFRKVNELEHPGKRNATKPNNAWWHWLRSGQRNPPVNAKTAHMHRDRLFKIAHFQTRRCRRKQANTIVRCGPGTRNFKLGQ